MKTHDVNEELDCVLKDHQESLERLATHVNLGADNFKVVSEVPFGQASAPDLKSNSQGLFQQRSNAFSSKIINIIGVSVRKAHSHVNRSWYKVIKPASIQSAMTVLKSMVRGIHHLEYLLNNQLKNN